MNARIFEVLTLVALLITVFARTDSRESAAGSAAPSAGVAA